MSSIAPAMPKPALHIITSSRPKRSTVARDERVHVFGARDVGDHRQRLAAGRDDLGRHRLEPIGAPRADGHRGAVARQPQRRRASDSGRCAGDRDDTSHRARIALRSLGSSALGLRAATNARPAWIPHIRLLRELVAVNSVNPTLVPGAPGEREIAELIAAEMRRGGLDVSIETVDARPAQRRRRARRARRRAGR